MLVDPYMDACRVTSRLVDEWKTHGTLIIGFDFDNTVYDYHQEGTEFPLVRKLLLECQELGFELVCFTGNHNTSLVNEVCKGFGLTNFKINYTNTVPLKTNKLFFNILLDDRAGLESAVKALSTTVNIIKVG